MDELITKNQNLVYYVLKKIGLYHLQDEYFDVGMIGLVKAGRTYTEEKGKFTTYAYRCIANEINAERRKQSTNKRQGEIISLNTEIKSADGLVLEDFIPSPMDTEQEVIRNEQMKEIKQIISRLSDKEQYVIKAYYGIDQDKEDQEQISKKLKISRSMVSRIITKVIIKMRNEVER